MPIRNLLTTMKVEPAIFIRIEKDCLDSGEAYLLRKSLDSLAKPEITLIVLDFSVVKYMSTAFLGSIIELHNILADKNKKLALTALDEHNRKVISVTKLDKILNVYTAPDDAFKALAH